MTSDFLIVGIGASAGGIKAIKTFFEHVPSDSGMAYVVILHLSPDFDSHLADVLQVSASIPVTQVRGRVVVEPNHVYVIPPNQSLAMLDGHLAVSDITRIEERRAPVDVFFRGLGENHHERAVAVVLSGTGANGSMGMKRIKELGGACFVQDPDEAEYSDMPRNSIATTLVDQILPVATIPGRIIAYKDALRSVQMPEESTGSAAADGHALREVFTLLRARTGHDFSNYKRGTVLRRIARRLGVHGIEDLNAYARFMREEPQESQALLKDLLISVTNFFRDDGSFGALASKVIPKLFAGKSDDDHLRVWIPGCATGEEAYSIAILLSEYADSIPNAPHMQVFASDIDDAAIAFGREGLYSLNDAADVSAERLRRFFTKDGDRYRVRKELREMVLFANHNIIKDPPFSHLDLVSCRNLLIYLNRTAQRRVMDVVHFALNPMGYLFVGSSESVEGAMDLFVAADGDAQIFQRRPVVSRPGLPIPDLSVVSRNHLQLTHRQAEDRARERLSTADLHQRLLEQYAAPSVLVTEEHEIVHVTEHAAGYLQFVGGDPTRNLLKVIRPELRIDLRTALYRSAQQRTNIDARGLTVRLDARTVTVNLLVRPVLRDEDPRAGIFLILFEEQKGEATATPSIPSRSLRSGDAARQLEDEIVHLRTQLRSTIEHHETQAEELKASNEELQAMNEELRSSAEELETSKEELQSVNEEMRTVNQELKVKVAEQVQATDDIQNLINSTEIGTVFLDRASRLKLFTPRVHTIFNLRPSDRGRPLSDISSTLVDADLSKDVERVIDRLERVERELETRDGRWLLMHATPYRTAEDRIDGVVLTFVDITERKRNEERLRRSEERLRRVIEIETVGIAFFDRNGRVTDANDAFLRMVGYGRLELEKGALTIDAITPAEWIPVTIEALQSVATAGRANPHEKEYLRKDGTRFWALAAVSRLDNDTGVKFVVDLTALKQAEEDTRRSDQRMRLMVDSLKEHAIFTLDEQGRIDTWNTGAARMFGYAEQEILRRPSAVLFTAEDRAADADERERQIAREHGQSSDERWHVRKDGTRFFASSVLATLCDERGVLIGYVKVARDLTERKHWEEAINSAHSELENRVGVRTRELADANASLDDELRVRREGEARIRALLRRLISVQEDERRRIARDLHDHLGQHVAGVGLSIESLEGLLQDRPDLASRARRTRELITKLDRDLDFFTWELRPPSLDDLGIAIALQNFVQEWSKNFGIAADYHSRGLETGRLAREIETNLYRIAQEALNNVYKHARARNVAVLLERRERDVVLMVEDDGRGFERQPTTQPGDTGIGLLGMSERASLVGGTLEIETTPGKGTTVYARIPFVSDGDEA